MVRAAEPKPASIYCPTATIRGVCQSDSNERAKADGGNQKQASHRV